MVLIQKTLVLSVALLMGLSGCDDKASQVGSTDAAATELSQVQLAGQINKAYMDNAIQAQRAWGGKLVTVGGTFDSAGRNTDGTTSILLTPDGTPPTIAEFNVGNGRDEFVANLSKGDTVTLQCTVDPKEQGFAVSYLASVPEK